MSVHLQDSPRRLSQLDSLRGIACLMVLLAHLKSVSLLSWIPDVTGTAGVGIFFAMSGFLITRILRAEREIGGGLTTFYSRRAARILPLYYLTLGVVRLFDTGNEFRQVATFSFNFCFLAGSRDYFQQTVTADAPPPLAHYWSLCVEEHFYWFWPLAVMFLPWLVVRVLPVFILVATPFITSLAAHYLLQAGLTTVEIDGLLSRMTLTQLPAICLGASIALHEEWIRNPLKQARTSIVGLTMCAIGAIPFALAARLPHEAARSIATTALHLICSGVFLCALGLPSLGKLSALRYVGTISYGLYLFHLPIYSYFGLLDITKPVRTYSAILAACVTFCLAAFSFRFVETPVMAFFRRRESLETAVPVRYFGVAVTGVIGLLFALSFAGTSRKSDAIETMIAEALRTPQIAPEAIHTIILGSSHGDFGIACSELSDPSYNLASPSQDLWYDNKIAHRMIERLPRLKRVVFTVSVFSFRHALCDAEQWREGLYSKLWRIPTRDDRQPSVAVPNGVAEMLSKALLLDRPNRGWTPLEPVSPLDIEGAEKVAKRHYIASNHRVADNVSLLKDAISTCQARNIECVLITTPTHAAYRRVMSRDYADYAKEAERLVAEIAAGGVSHLDYSRNERFQADDFYDVDHLNREGAVKFSRMLNYDLQSSSREHRKDSQVSDRSSSYRK